MATDNNDNDDINQSDEILQMSNRNLDLFLPHLDDVKIPTQDDKIFKDECCYSFDTPDSQDGIFICMKTFLGLSKKFLEFHYARTGSSVYLNIRRITTRHKKAENDDKSKITKLAINIEGGFQTTDEDVEQQEFNCIILMPNFTEVSLDAMEIPYKIVLSVSGILSAESAEKQEEIESLKNTWDGETRQVSKHSETLQQIDNGVRVPPNGWKCEKCDIREGLWLNLTDGAIRCGRKYFDGTGGNNHAAEHYDETKYPLVVKLGTITINGADVYSYDEDAMVLDPNLDKHLAHFGINISDCRKTEKSMIEMEIDLNKRFDEWSIIQEDGSELRPLYGPGFTGMANLGNSCYLNSVMQMLFTIPNFIEEYYISDKKLQYEKSNHQDPTGDLRTQLMKLSSGLLSGDYSQFSTNSKEQIGIRPKMFKNLIGKNHPDFQSKRQQDAQEFLLYVLEQIERMHQKESSSTTTSTPSPSDCFKLEIEQRVECLESKKVKYTTRCESHLSLSVTNVPIQNKQEYDEFLLRKSELENLGEKIDSNQTIHPIIKLTDCLENFFSAVQIDDFFSSAINRKTTATMTSRCRTFPDYLLIHLKKFTLNQNWVPIKLDVSMQVPDILDLELYRAKGKQPGEEELPEETETTNANTNTTNSSSDGQSSSSQQQQQSSNVVQKFEFNSDYLQQLSEMGFQLDACKRALFNTKNSGIEQATSWLFEHMDDPDFSKPFILNDEENSQRQSQQQQQSNSSSSSFQVNPETLKNLQDMGIPERYACLALKINNNDPEQAINWYFSNEHRIDEAEREQRELEKQQQQQQQNTNIRSPEPPTPINLTDGYGKYELIGLISHMGTSTFCGHYVAHLKKSIPNNTNGTDGNSDQQQWIIFNDNKVAISERPPKQFAYIYLYRRINE